MPGPFVGFITEADQEREIQRAATLIAILDAARHLASRDLHGADAALMLASSELKKLMEMLNA